MATNKHMGDSCVSSGSEPTVTPNQSVSCAPQRKMDSVANISDENDRNSSPSKTTDPARKKTFKIISMNTKKGESGDIPADNDADSVDGLDESQTEDWSSELYDNSKATDLDTDGQDNLIPLTPDEVVSTTTILVKQKPDRDSQSRFKVVKIETKEPFRRGKWVCYDFFDTAPVVTVEKNGSKVTADSIIQSEISVNLSSSNSVHYVHSVNDSSSNILFPLSPMTDDPALLSKVFVPITPVLTDQVLNNPDQGYSSDNMVPFPSQPALLTTSGVLSTSSSYQNIVHPGQGQTTLVQSLPQTNVFPYTQNASGALFQNGIMGVATSIQSNQAVNVPDKSMLTSVGSTPTAVPSATVAVAPKGNDYNAAPQENSAVNQGTNFMHVGGVVVPQSQGQGQVANVAGAQKVSSGGDSAASVSTAISGNSSVSTVVSAGTAGHAINAVSQDPSTDFSNTSSALHEQPGLIGVAMDESTGSTKTLQGDPQLPTSGLVEAVEAVYMELDNNEDDAEEKYLMKHHSCFNPAMRPANLPDPLDSPFHLYSPAVKSPSVSPVPFIEQLVPDRAMSSGQLFRTASASPINTLMPDSVTSGEFIQGFEAPTMPMSSTFPDAFLSTSYYFPFPNSQVQGSIFSPNSAFQSPAVVFRQGADTSQSQPSIPSDPAARPMAYEALSGLAAQIPGCSEGVSQVDVFPGSPLAGNGKDRSYDVDVYDPGKEFDAKQSVSMESEGYVRPSSPPVLPCHTFPPHAPLDPHTSSFT